MDGWMVGGRTGRRCDATDRRDIAMRHHITKTCQAVYLEIRRITSIRYFLTEEATKTLVTSCILSRIDYCNALLIGCPSSVTQPLQTVQNAAARLIFR
jgi:hypothetical protein